MAVCSQCGQEIMWTETQGGKWQPRNLNGSNHFASCGRSPDIRQKWSKAKRLRIAMNRTFEQRIDQENS